MSADSRSRRPSPTRLVAALLSTVVLLGGCAADDGPGPATDGDDGPAARASETTPVTGSTGASLDDCSPTADARFPDVVDATLTEAGDGAFTVAATLCSAYDTAERYADAWRVKVPAGDVLGVRELLHDHAGEQPFTRSLGDPVEVPADVDTLVVEGRDLANGWGGGTFEVEVPDR